MEDDVEIESIFTEITWRVGNSGRKPRKFLRLVRATIAERQGESEDQKLAAKLTQPKNDSSGYFGITKGEAWNKFS